MIREWRILCKTMSSTLYFLCHIFNVIKYKKVEIGKVCDKYETKQEYRILQKNLSVETTLVVSGWIHTLIKSPCTCFIGC